MTNRCFQKIILTAYFLGYIPITFGGQSTKGYLYLQIFDTQPEFLHLVKDTINIDSIVLDKLLKDMKMKKVGICDDYLCGHTGIHLKVTVTNNSSNKIESDTLLIDYGFGCLKTNEATIWNYKTKNNCVMTTFSYGKFTRDYLTEVWNKKKRKILDKYDYKDFDLIKKQ